MPSIRLTPKGIVIDGDLRAIAPGQGYFVPSLNPVVTEIELRQLLTGRRRYKHVILKGVLGVLVEPIGQGKRADTPAPTQSADVQPPE